MAENHNPLNNRTIEASTSSKEYKNGQADGYNQGIADKRAGIKYSQPSSDGSDYQEGFKAGYAVGYGSK